MVRHSIQFLYIQKTAPLLKLFFNHLREHLVNNVRQVQQPEENADGDEEKPKSSSGTPAEPRTPTAPVAHVFMPPFLLIVGKGVPVLML
jgi:hypothetical protein